MPRQRLGRPSSPVMVGRNDELDLMIAAIARSPALVLIEGESGVGKTRLIQELAARPELGGRQVLVGRCQELSEPFPFGPLVEAVRVARPPQPLPAVTGVLRTLLPELAACLPEAPAALVDVGAERHRLFRGLLELLAALGPTLLIVEDLHWADQATAEFLRFLAVHQPSQVAVVGTYRREDLSDGSPLLSLDASLPPERTAVRIVLVPLRQEQVGELVRTILDGVEVSDALAEYLCQRTAGLPLAVEEVLLLLRQRHDLILQQGALMRHQLDELAVPPKLRDAINERLSRLSPSARFIVHAAAILTLAADEEVLGQLTGLDEIACGDALAEALGSALLVEIGDGRYGFRHSLARQAVEEGVPGPLRRRLHLRAARVLEKPADRPLARLAHHYRAAGVTATWVRYAEAAADRAFSLNDHAAAYALLRDAVSIRTISPVTRGSLAIRLARHAARCRAYDDALATLHPLLDDDAIPARLRGRLRFWLARLLHDTSESQAARDEAVRALDDLDEPSAAQVLSWLATVPSGLDPIAQRLAWIDRAMAYASRSNNRALTIEIAACRAMLLVSVGDAGCWDAIRDFPRPGHAGGEIEQAIRGYGNIADALLHIGHYRRASEFNREAMRLASEHSPSFAVNFEMTIMQLDWLTGQWNGLEQRLRTLISAIEDWPIALHLCEAFLGLQLLARGRPREALLLLEPLADKFEGDSRVLTWIAAGIAQARMAERKPAAAVAAITPVLRIVERDGNWLWAGDLIAASVPALLADGQAKKAVRIVDRLDEAVRGRDVPGAIAALAMCRALMAEPDNPGAEAASLFLAADRAWQALPRPYEAAKARARAGHCLLATDPTRGHEILLDALATFTELGAEWEAELARHVLRRHGLLPAHRRGRRSYGRELSPRESEVVRLAAEGLHNREIAQALHLSIKTVEGHLSSARRKLGTSPRTTPRTSPPAAPRGAQGQDSDG